MTEEAGPVSNVTGKVCIITGGGGSIGLVDGSEDALARAARDLEAGPDVLTTVKANVTDIGETREYVDRTTARWGKIDVLFSHAGIAGVIKPVVEYPEDVFDAVMAVNVRGSFLACKYCLPQMNDGGSIVITSSIMGLTADPGVCAYAASKHALIGLMRVVAKEAAPRKIRVNVLAPGPVDNPFQSKIEASLTELVGRDGTEFLNGVIPLGRHASPGEIARMFLFLASDQSSFSTGGIFTADGGMNI
jgi:NAD(P)-dependent dehydrogenase (short-subunit alcohol dehydrogenase family)